MEQNNNFQIFGANSIVMPIRRNKYYKASNTLQLFDRKSTYILEILKGKNNLDYIEITDMYTYSEIDILSQFLYREKRNAFFQKRGKSYFPTIILEEESDIYE